MRFILLLLMFIVSVMQVNGQVVQNQELHRKLVPISDSTQYVDAINRIGFLLHLKSADSCLYYGMKAKACADRIGYEKGKAEAMTNVATALFLNGLYRESLKIFSQVLAMYRRQDNVVGQVGMLMNLAVVYDVLGDKKKALNFSKESVHAGKSILLDSTMSAIYPNYVYLHSELSNDSASYYLNLSEKIANTFNDSRSRITIWQQRGARLFAAGKIEEGRVYIEKALALSRKRTWEYHEIVSLQYLADYFLACKQPSHALACYQSAFAVANLHKFLTFKTELLRQQRAVLQMLNDRNRVAEIDGLLVEALGGELTNNKQFVGDYVAFLNQAQELRLLEGEQKYNNRKIFTLLLALALCCAAILYVVQLYRRLLKASLLTKQLNSQNTKLLEQLNVSHNELQRQFSIRTHIISAVTHDIRTPLRFVLMNAEHLLGLVSRHQSHDSMVVASAVVNSTRRVQQLVDNMIAYSKAVYNEGDVKFEEINLWGLLADRKSIFSGFSPSVHESIKLRGDRELVVNSSPHLLSIIIHNLLDNAIKFSSNGCVEVIITRQSDQCCLVISNDGPGFSANQLRWINTSNATFDETPADTSQIGLGLVIAKEICQILSIEILAESHSGASVSLFIPD